MSLACASDSSSELQCPKSIDPNNCYIMYSSLEDPSDNSLYVRPIIDFSNEDIMNDFPMDIGHWIGKEYNVTPWKGNIGAKNAVLRGYKQPDTSEIWLLLMQSGTPSDFVPPNINYPAMEWEIVDQGVITINLEESMNAELNNSSIPIDANILLVSSMVQEYETYEQRRIILYCYFKQLNQDDAPINMIRISTVIQNDSSYEETLNAEIQFFQEIISLIIEPIYV